MQLSFLKKIINTYLPLITYVIFALIFLNFNYFDKIQLDFLEINHQIANGKLLYSDINTVYPPGVFYLFVFLLKITNSILIIKYFYFIIGFGIILLLKKLSQVIGLKYYGFYLSITGVFLSNYLFTLKPIYISLFFILFSAIYLIRYFEKTKNMYLVKAGILLGIAALFRHDAAGYLLGAMFQAVFFFSLSDPEISHRKSKAKIFFSLKKALFFGVFCFATLPILIYFILKFGLINLWNNLIINPLYSYRETNNIAFPLFDGNLYQDFFTILFFWSPLIILLISLISIIIRVRRKKLKLIGLRFWKEMTIFNLGINLFNLAMVKSDIEHIFPIYIFAYLLLNYHIERYIFHKNKLEE